MTKLTNPESLYICIGKEYKRKSTYFAPVINNLVILDETKWKSFTASKYKYQEGLFYTITCHSEGMFVIQRQPLDEDKLVDNNDDVIKLGAEFMRINDEDRMKKTILKRFRDNSSIDEYKWKDIKKDRKLLQYIKAYLFHL